MRWSFSRAPYRRALVLSVAMGTALLPAHAHDVALPTASAHAPPACVCVPAGTPVQIEVAETLSSDVAETGMTFALKLAQPIELDGRVIVPAGTPGLGEIVHAERARSSGKPGELILAARYLDWNGARIPLRAMKLGGSGSDRTGVVAGVAVAASVFALFIHGGQMQVPAGTVAHAKLAAPIDAPTPAPEPPDTTTPQQD